MAKCLVTGHKGYIGSKLYSRLKELGHEVHGVDIKSLTATEGLDIRSHLFYNGKPWLKFEPEYIFHLAAKPSVPWSVEHPSESLSHNVLGSSRVLEFARETGARRVIFASSAAAYGLASPYGLHKLMTEQECKLYSDLYDVDTVSLRYFNVYSADQKYGGPYSTVISAWMEAMRWETPLRIDGDGLQTRDFIHVDDIISANIFCMNHEEKFNGSTYDVGTGVETSIAQIRDYIDNRFSILWNEMPTREGDIRFSCANVEPLKQMGWSAQINIENGLKDCFGGQYEKQ
jgi:UDP-glucose 4-epimerase